MSREININIDNTTIAEDFWLEAHEDYIGLSQISGRSESRCAPGGDVVTDVIEVVRTLLARGLFAGRLARDGDFDAWSNQDPEAMIGRIRRECVELGRRPSIDDICWFYLPR